MTQQFASKTGRIPAVKKFPRAVYEERLYSVVLNNIFQK